MKENNALNIMKYFFRGVIRNVVEIFSGRNLGWHLLAIALTFVIVMSGFDWKFFVFASSVSWRGYFFPALGLGGILPILLPLALILIGLIVKKRKALMMGMAIAQAAFLGVVISSFYKAFTGRIQPPGHSHTSFVEISNLVDSSHQFLFGFLRHGVFWGWPSSHTTIAFAMSMTAWMLFPKNKAIRFIVLAYAIFVGIGTVVTSIHWFSEFVAGAIFGTLIGIVVGKSYLNKFTE